MSLSWLENRFGAKTVRLTRPRAAEVAPHTQRSSEVNSSRLNEIASDGREAPAWQTALHALERQVQTSAGHRKGQPLRVIIANEFVRYLVIPWQAEGLTEAEREQLARALLLERYGEQEGQWQLALEPQRFGKPALAAAVEADMIAALRVVVEQQGYRVSAIVPALIDELNRHRRQLGKVRSGWLVDASEERLASLAFVRDQWTQVGNERFKLFSSAFESILVPQLRRDALRMPELLKGTVFLVNSVGNELPGRVDHAWPLVELRGRP